MERGSDYDPIAGMYDRLWDDWYLPAAIPVLEKLLFSKVPSGAVVLDLCCGSGHATKGLVAHGYEVTGVDSSAILITLARKALPGVTFLVQDARDLSFNNAFDAVISTFDSLNHILTLADLEQVFGGVRRALRRDGLFVFDMNLEEAYSADLHGWSVTVDETEVTLVRGTYDRETHVGATVLIWFQQENTNEQLWRRHSSVVKERCYPMADIFDALNRAGFQNIDEISAVDAGMRSQLALGRHFFAAR